MRRSCYAVGRTPRQDRLQPRRERSRQLIGRDADRLVDAGETVLGKELIPLLAKDQTDGRGVGRVLEPVVDDVPVEVQLAGILGPELPLLQINDDERPQSQMVEKQVDVEVLVAIPGNEGKERLKQANAQLGTFSLQAAGCMAQLFNSADCELTYQEFIAVSSPEHDDGLIWVEARSPLDTQRAAYFSISPSL